MVIWVIGLSGSGKTTLGRHIYDLFKKDEPNTVFVDGDEIRQIFGHNKEVSYTIEGRRVNAQRICQLCAWLDRQNMNVVCCITSLFEESREWNRRTYSKYFEVFISVPLEILKKRDPKGLYRAIISGAIKNVIGVDIPFSAPKNPDYIFDNSKNNVDLEKVALDILNKARALA